MASGGAGGGGDAIVIPELEDSEIVGPIPDLEAFVTHLQSEKEEELKSTNENTPLKEVFLCLVKNTKVNLPRFARVDVLKSIIPKYFSWIDETQRIARSNDIHIKVKFLRKTGMAHEVAVELPVSHDKLNLYVSTLGDTLRKIRPTVPPGTPEKEIMKGPGGGGAKGGSSAAAAAADAAAPPSEFPFLPNERRRRGRKTQRRTQRRRKQRKTRRSQRR